MNLADFRLRVARKLGLVSQGEDLSPEDGELIAEGYHSLWHQLDDHGLISWDIRDELPEPYEFVLVGMTAASLVDEFRVPEPARSFLKAQGDFGLRPVGPLEAQLRAAMSAGAPSGTIKAEYF